MIKRFIIIIFVIFILAFLWIYWGPKPVSGQVVDSVTGNGIASVTVSAWQRGWGYDDYLVWDKNYYSTTVTDQNGRFKLWYYRGGTSVHLQFSKDGYHSTKPGYPLQDTYIDFWEKPTVKLESN